MFHLRGIQTASGRRPGKDSRACARRTGTPVKSNFSRSLRSHPAAAVELCRSLRTARRGREPRPGRSRQAGADLGRRRLGADRAPSVEQGRAGGPALRQDPERRQREAARRPGPGRRRDRQGPRPFCSRSTPETTPRSSGVEPEEAPRLLEAALARAHIRVDGLMTIAPLSEDPAVAAADFRATCARSATGSRPASGARSRELSMGMSGDLEAGDRRGKHDRARRHGAFRRARVTVERQVRPILSSGVASAAKTDSYFGRGNGRTARCEREALLSLLDDPSATVRQALLVQFHRARRRRGAASSRKSPTARTACSPATPPGSSRSSSSAIRWRVPRIHPLPQLRARDRRPPPGAHGVAAPRRRRVLRRASTRSPPAAAS